MKVKECMCNQICAEKQETTIYDIAKLMQTNNIGCVPICDNSNSIVGIVTDRDIVLRGVGCDKNTKTTPVSEIMTTNIYCCTPNDDIYDAECKMSQNQVRRMPVLENNQVVGMSTIGDLAQNSRQIGKREVSSTISNICQNNG